ncbi:MAG: septum formation protein Maf [Bacteroidetes bacterium]|nr:MAG: septum formation protein Maf [Bacteroidota bacterium]
MFLKNLEKYKIILASKSPRRQNLLKELGVDFEIVENNNVDEVYPEDLTKHDIPVFLAEKKAQGLFSKITGNELIITSDTIVLFNNEVIEKPVDYNDAVKMLNKLSGNKHTVVSGVCITTKQKQVSFSADTDVYFNHLTEDEIKYYIDNFKPFDKAGAYGIQEWIGFIGVEKIEGSYFNVMGLPIHRLYDELKKF